MQDKNLGDMAAKYKEEMMKLYSRKPPAEQTGAEPPHTAAEADETAPPRKNVNAAAQSKNLSKPPMPRIPEAYGNMKKSVPQAPDMKGPAPRFPPAEEILRAEEAHEQGNYDYSKEEAAESYPDENTDFETPDIVRKTSGGKFPDDNAADMSGQGFLQVEVTAADRAVPVRDATVIITESIHGKDSLISMSVTDESGASSVIPLPAPSGKFSDAPEPSERPYSEYNIGVYRKGFYSVPKLTVPVFDTIKSIQPVSLIPLAGDPEGSVFRSGKEADNG